MKVVTNCLETFFSALKLFITIIFEALMAIENFFHGLDIVKSFPEVPNSRLALE